MKPRTIAACALAGLVFTVVAAVLFNLPQTKSAPTPTASASIAQASECNATANGYCYGFSTYYVATRRDVPRNWGNAKTWYAHAQRDGYQVGAAPKKGAIAWTNSGPWGDVAYVESVSTDGGWVTVSSMNYAGNWNKVITRSVPVGAFKYIY